MKIKKANGAINLFIAGSDPSSVCDSIIHRLKNTYLNTKEKIVFKGLNKYKVTIIVEEIKNEKNPN